MDLTKLPNDKKLELCKNYFIVGCIMLPFVWAINVLWFFREAFLMPAYEEQKIIRKYVLMSAAGSLLWAFLLIIWITTFQTNRVSWGAIGEDLSFITPLGRA